jgi:hypothetical protein
LLVDELSRMRSKRLAVRVDNLSRDIDHVMSEIAGLEYGRADIVASIRRSELRVLEPRRVQE